MKKIDTYINEMWDRLTRNFSDVFEMISEEKYDAPNLLFISPKENALKVKEKVGERVNVIRLPKSISKIFKMSEQGLLYLPHPYVVPGGRFNEMYGWDSFFIIIGLIRSGRIELAKNMADNQIYQIKYYGKVLNANRTYYMSRSHPPLVSASVLAVYNETKDKKWLRSCIKPLERYFNYFRKGKKYNEETKLSRYYDESSLPSYELRSEDEKSYYNEVKNFFRNNKAKTNYPISVFYNRKRNTLTKIFYRADRSMRESGLDITDLFGDFSCEINFTAPVCLNSLLCNMAKNISEIYSILENKNKSFIWKQKEAELSEAVNRYLWNDEHQSYFNYDLCMKKTKPYLYATIFYPLWAGIASKSQADKVVKASKRLITEFGLLCSCETTGKQWDAPFGWAPFHYFAVIGLDNYGYKKEAKDLALSFIKTIEKEFDKTGVIKEKYNVQNPDKEVDIKFGYSSNEDGFGWTNGVYLYFTQYLS